MKFYKVVLEPVETQNVLEYAYKRFADKAHTLNAIRNNQIRLTDRLGDGKCSECGASEWIILPVKHPFVSLEKNGTGKPIIQCYNCGNITHL